MSHPLSTAYQRRLAQLSTRTAAVIALRWDAHDGLDDEVAARFASDATPIALNAQRQAAYLADGYLAAFLSTQLGRRITPQGFDPDEFTGPAVRSGSSPRDVWQRSVVTARAAIARGRDYTDARAEGRARAMMTARTDVALTARAVTASVTGRTEEVTGYRRVLGSKPCELCVGAAAKTYRKQDLMPIHASCSCGVEPVTGPVEMTEPDEVKVVQHDELGPMLWQPEHDFAVLH